VDALRCNACFAEEMRVSRRGAPARPPAETVLSLRRVRHPSSKRMQNDTAALAPRTARYLRVTIPCRKSRRFGKRPQTARRSHSGLATVASCFTPRSTGTIVAMPVEASPGDVEGGKSHGAISRRVLHAGGGSGMAM
jgi:hypothetical protein